MRTSNADTKPSARPRMAPHRTPDGQDGIRQRCRMERGVVVRIVTGPHEAHRQDPHLPMRYDTGRPRAVIRLRISQAEDDLTPCPRRRWALPPYCWAIRRRRPDRSDCGPSAPSTDRPQDPRHLRPLQHHQRAGTARGRRPAGRLSGATRTGDAPLARAPDRCRCHAHRAAPPPRATHHRVRVHDDQRLLEQKMLRDHRSHATGATQPRGHDGQMKQGEQEVLHARDRVGQTSGATQRCLILESARELGIRDAQVSESQHQLPFSCLARSPVGPVLRQEVRLQVAASSVAGPLAVVGQHDGLAVAEPCGCVPRWREGSSRARPGAPGTSRSCSDASYWRPKFSTRVATSAGDAVGSEQAVLEQTNASGQRSGPMPSRMGRTAAGNC